MKLQQKTRFALATATSHRGTQPYVHYVHQPVILVFASYFGLI